jgi:hypothetical protein
VSPLVDPELFDGRLRYAFVIVHVVGFLLSAVPVVVLATTFNGSDRGPTFGYGLVAVILFPYALAFALPATAVTVVSLPLARWWYPLAMSQRAPRVATFVALAIGWLLAWLLCVTTLAVLPGAYWGWWSLPYLMLYLALSAVVATLLDRREQRIPHVNAR